MTQATDDELLARDEAAALDIYESKIRATVTPADAGKFIAVAVESGDFELDRKSRGAFDRLIARRPDERIWLMRVGPQPAYRMAGAGQGTGT